MEEILDAVGSRDEAKALEIVVMGPNPVLVRKKGLEPSRPCGH
jgi:hypothetical protein